MKSFSDVFVVVKRILEEKLTATSFNLFIKPLVVLEDFNDDENKVVLKADGDWAKGMIEKNFLTYLMEGFEEVLGFTVIIEIYADEEEQPKKSGSKLTGEYEFTFENFIVGSTNKFAHAAALAVAQHPSTAYNPLFIYGDSGLGKTHLLNAIKIELKQNNENINIIHVDGEAFTNEIISAIRDNTTALFHNKYRQADVFLVDDIQFLAGKDTTQEEFFHTFNALHSAGKQIVLVSDRPPKEIKSLEDRLRTRFEWGLTADIQPPDFETRCAIIERKAAYLHLEIKRDVVEFIASKVKTNIRQLEGVVKKLFAFNNLDKTPPSLQTAQLAIKDILSEEMPVPATIDKILIEVGRILEVSADDILSNKRDKNISKARQIAIYIVREVCQITLEEVGKNIGNRDHSTVVYSINKVEDQMKIDTHFKNNIEDIIKNVKTL